jgi:hypothetical protein
MTEIQQTNSHEKEAFIQELIKREEKLILRAQNCYQDADRWSRYEGECLGRKCQAEDDLVYLQSITNAGQEMAEKVKRQAASELREEISIREAKLKELLS